MIDRRRIAVSRVGHARSKKSGLLGTPAMSGNARPIGAKDLMDSGS